MWIGAYYINITVNKSTTGLDKNCIKPLLINDLLDNL